MKRIAFIKKSGAAAAMLPLIGATQPIKSLAMAPAFNSKKLKTIGLGLFSLPKLLESDFENTLHHIAQMGYRELEFFGPYTFSSAPAKARWNAVAPLLGFKGSGLFGRSTQEVTSLLRETGLSVPAMHTDLISLETHMEALAQTANALGAQYLVLPAIPEALRQTEEDYKKMADRFNAIGANAKSHGVSFAYHNHGYGLKSNGNSKPLDHIFNGTDPELVFFEMDIFWTVAGRANPISLLKEHPKRYKMLHIKDMKQLSYFATDGGNEQEWMALFPALTTVGNGVLDIEGIVAAGKENGVQHFFVEQDLAPDPINDLQNSINYLKNIEL